MYWLLLLTERKVHQKTVLVKDVMLKKSCDIFWASRELTLDSVDLPSLANFVRMHFHRCNTYREPMADFIIACCALIVV